MRALLIGPTAPDFDPGYNEGIRRALEKLGCKTQVCEFFAATPAGVANRIFIDGGLTIGLPHFYKRYIEDFNQLVMAIYTKHRPDIVIVIRGSKVSATTLESMSAIKVLWCHDVVRRCGIDEEQLKAYDRLYVFEPKDVDWLDHKGLTSTFLPAGFDPQVYRPLTVRKDIDVFFIGAYYPERRDTLEQIAECFKNNTLRFYGRHLRYREPATWLRYLYYISSGKREIFLNHYLSAPQINEMYSRSKVCINMHHAQNEYGCNPRVFEIAGSGQYQVVDDLPFIKKEFGDLLTTYADITSLKDAIHAGLQDDKIRTSNVEAARELALDAHTFSHRMRVILGDCNML